MTVTECASHKRTLDLNLNLTEYRVDCPKKLNRTITITTTTSTTKTQKETTPG